MKEPKAMKEIHEIRLKLYEEWKNMTPEEMLASIEEGAEKMRQKLAELNTGDESAAKK